MDKQHPALWRDAFRHQEIAASEDAALSELLSGTELDILSEFVSSPARQSTLIWRGKIDRPTEPWRASTADEAGSQGAEVTRYTVRVLVRSETCW